MDITRAWYETKSSVDRHDTTGLREGEQYLLDYFLTGKVLDIGCGTGRFTAYLSDGIGIDYSQAMIDRAKLNYPNTPFYKMDVRRMAFQNHSFDGIVFTFNGIDYLYPEKERSLALTEIRRVLKSGGVFAFATHTDSRPHCHTLKQFIGWIATIVLRLPHQYFASWTGTGFAITHHASLQEQVQSLRAHGFSFVGEVPIKGGHMIIAKV